MDKNEVMEYHRDIAKEYGISMDEAEERDEYYLWLDPPQEYILFHNSNIHKSSMKEILAVGPVKIEYLRMGKTHTIVYESIEEMLKDFDRETHDGPTRNDDMIEKVVIDGERLLYSGDFEGLLEELELHPKGARKVLSMAKKKRKAKSKPRSSKKGAKKKQTIIEWLLEDIGEEESRL